MKSFAFPQSNVFPSEQNHIDTYISHLDPLLADEKLKLLPELNGKRETKELIIMLSEMLPSIPEIRNFDYYMAVAAIRDIGMLLGSLKRHSIEPEFSVQGLPLKLNLLSEKTNLPPRDTLLHYTVWNPDGERLRTYTGTNDEKSLIESVKIAMNPLVHAIYGIRNLYSISPDTVEFGDACDKVKEKLDKMVKAIVHARKNVSPQYFAHELRLYFDPITLDGKEYLGPGAVEMPLFVFDHILWGADCKEEEYIKFKETYLPYILPEIRMVFHEFSGQKSLLRKICAMLDTTRSYDKNIHRSVKKLRELCIILKSFRMPHKKVADEAYAQTENNNKREKGSGGYHPDILAYIMKLNFQRIDELEASIQNYGDMHLQVK